MWTFLRSVSCPRKWHSFVGPLPAPVRRTTTFVAGIPVSAPHFTTGQAHILHLATPGHAAMLLAVGWTRRIDSTSVLSYCGCSVLGLRTSRALLRPVALPGWFGDRFSEFACPASANFGLRATRSRKRCAHTCRAPISCKELATHSSPLVPLRATHTVHHLRAEKVLLQASTALPARQDLQALVYCCALTVRTASG